MDLSTAWTTARSRLIRLIDRDPLHYDESGRRPWFVLLTLTGCLLLLGVLGHWWFYRSLRAPLVVDAGESEETPRLEVATLDRVIARYDARAKALQRLLQAPSTRVDPSL